MMVGSRILRNDVASADLEDGFSSGLEEDEDAAGPIDMADINSGLEELGSKHRLEPDSPHESISKMRRVIPTFDPNYSPMSVEKRALQDGTQALSQLSPLQRKQVCIEIETALLPKLGVQLSPEKLPESGHKRLTPRREAKLAKQISSCNRCAVNLLSEVARTDGASPGLALDRQLISWDHITQPDEKGGFHFCPKNHPLRSQLQNIVVNPETGVFVASFHTSKKNDKQSTFFPEYITDLSELNELIRSAKQVSSKKTRYLLLVTKEGKAPFYVQAYTKGNGVLVSSLFPIFFFKDLPDDDKTMLEIDGKLYSRQNLLDLIAKTAEVAFMVGGKKVYDIANLLKSSKISNGVFIGVSGKLRF